MAEHAVGSRSGPRAPAQVVHPPSAEASRSDGPLRIAECGVGLRVAGEIDLNGHEVWERALRRTTERGGEVRLDLSELAFIDVHGTALLVDLAAALPEDRRVVVRGAPAGLHRVMEVLWPGGTTAITFEGEQ
ncbi:MAG TPA: STAS domain-containing protein [Glycomyces sp.]|nr:STAS domain-containing protein [Glycomyces sp.]